MVFVSLLLSKAALERKFENQYSLVLLLVVFVLLFIL